MCFTNPLHSACRRRFLHAILKIAQRHTSTSSSTEGGSLQLKSYLPPANQSSTRIRIKYRYLQEAQLSQRDHTTLSVMLSHPRSFEITLLSRACVSPYQYFIETMSVSRTVSEIFSVKEWLDLETGDRGRLRSLEMPPFDRPYNDFLLVRHSIYSSIRYRFCAT